MNPTWILSGGSLFNQTSPQGLSDETFTTHLFIQHIFITHFCESDTTLGTVHPEEIYSDCSCLSSPQPTPHILKLFPLFRLPLPFSATCPRKSSTKSSAWPSLSLTGWPSGRGMNWRSKPGCSKQRLYKYICTYIKIYVKSLYWSSV